MQTDLTPIELLDQIHAAILTADFDGLGVLTPALENALQRAQTITDLRLLGQIQSKAERNAACLLAAGRGVRAAQRRLAELREARQGFSTYDGRGQRAQHGLQNSVARRY